MGDLIELSQPVPGHKTFLTCACTGGDSLLVVIMHDARGYFIHTLVCPACRHEIPVSFGRPVYEGGARG